MTPLYAAFIALMVWSALWVPPLPIVIVKARRGRIKVRWRGSLPLAAAIFAAITAESFLAYAGLWLLPAPVSYLGLAMIVAGIALNAWFLTDTMRELLSQQSAGRRPVTLAFSSILLAVAGWALSLGSLASLLVSLTIVYPALYWRARAIEELLPETEKKLGGQYVEYRSF